MTGIDFEGSGNDNSPNITPWLRAKLSDFLSIDFEEPIRESRAADCNELSDCFHNAMGHYKEPEPGWRVFSMLAAITGMHFKPEDKNDPFGPMYEGPKGRSAIPSDFKEHIEIISKLFDSTKSIVLKARLADVCALLERNRFELGFSALLLYVEIIEKVDAGIYKFRFEKTRDALSHDACSLLRRALTIGRMFGWDKPEAIRARELTAQLRIRSIQQQSATVAHWFNNLDIEFGVSDTNETANELEKFIIRISKETDLDVLADLWRLASRAYHRGKKNEERDRCRSEAAECFVKQSEHAPSTMLAAHSLSKAIAQLHGIRNKKDRRIKLRARLVEVQTNISEEMSPFYQEIDLTALIAESERVFRKLGLRDQFFALAVISGSPSLESLQTEAQEIIRKYPLSSLFGATHHDATGKVVHRTSGGGFGDHENDDAIQTKIAKSESIRRTYVVSSQFEIARQIIIEGTYLSEDILVRLLAYSPFVPTDRLMTFSRGFIRLFQGDFVSAVYILTPLLENSLRHVLKLCGEDVSIFDDATQTQKDLTISAIFDQLREPLDRIFSPDITGDIERVFLDQPGPCQRHAVAHGLLSDGGAYTADSIYGCWLIFRLCLLPLMPNREQINLGQV